jgi:hypothetical protein
MKNSNISVDSHFQESVSQPAGCSSNSGKTKVESPKEIATKLQLQFGKDNYHVAEKLARARNQWNEKNHFCLDFKHSAAGILKNERICKLVSDAYNANSYVCPESGFLLPSVPGKYYGFDQKTGSFGFDIKSLAVCRKHQTEARINVEASKRKRTQLGTYLQEATGGLQGELESYTREIYAGPSTRSRKLPLASISAHIHTEQLSIPIPIPIIPTNNQYFYIGLGISSVFMVFFRGVFLQPVEFQPFDSFSSYIEFE